MSIPNAVKIGAKISDIAEMIHTHPTLSEVLMGAVLDTNGLTIHTLRNQKS